MRNPGRWQPVVLGPGRLHWAGARCGQPSTPECAARGMGIWPRQVCIADVVVFDLFVCALTAHDQAYCFGQGWAGQLGNGDFANQAFPVPVAEAQYVMSVPGTRDEHLLNTFALSIAGPVRPVAPPCLLLPVPPALDAVTVGSAAPGCAQPNATQAWSDVLSVVSPAMQGKWLNHPVLAAPFRTLSSHLQQASNGSLGNHSDVYIAAVRSCSDGGGGQAWETHQYMVSPGDGGLRVADGGQCSVGVGCGGWSLATRLCLGGVSCGEACGGGCRVCECLCAAVCAGGGSVMDCCCDKCPGSALCGASPVSRDRAPIVALRSIAVDRRIKHLHQLQLVLFSVVSDTWLELGDLRPNCLSKCLTPQPTCPTQAIWGALINKSGCQDTQRF